MLIINQNTECVTTKSCGSSNALSLYLLRTAQDRSGPLSATLAFLECLMSSTNRRHSTRSATGIAADKVQPTHLVAQRKRMQHTKHKPEAIQKQTTSNLQAIHKQVLVRSCALKRLTESRFRTVSADLHMAHVTYAMMYFFSSSSILFGTNLPLRIRRLLPSIDPSVQS